MAIFTARCLRRSSPSITDPYVITAHSLALLLAFISIFSRLSCLFLFFSLILPFFDKKDVGKRQAKYLAGNKSEPVLQTLREDRAAMHAALRVITETFTAYAIACMEQGASGIFYATNGWASESMLTADQYREFGEQYDLEFLDAIKSRSKFNILHNCGTHIYFDQIAAYPVQAVNWDVAAEGNPDLGTGKMRSGKAVMGGINQKTTLKNGTPEQVREEVARAIELTGGTHFLLAPGCSIPPETPARNLEAIRRALS